MQEKFDARRLARRGLWHYRRSHLPLALGVAVATAVLTGALVVGDSVRGSLRGLTLERLGRYDHAIAPGAPMRTALAGELTAAAEADGRTLDAEPVVMAPGSLSARVDGENRRASRVTLYGVRPTFWAGGDDPRPADAPEEGLLLTEALATELGVAAGDEVVVRVGAVSALPADSTLGEKSDTTVSLRVEVAAVLPNRGLARFGLRPSQQTPRNAFLPLATAQRLLGLEGRCNVLMLAGDRRGAGAEPATTDWLAENIRPRLEDYGLSLEAIGPGGVQIESAQLVLPEEVVAAVSEAYGADRVETVATYLANTIRAGERSIPYSTVAGVVAMPDTGRVIAEDEIVLNRWAADDLQAAVGDSVTLTYYEPESTHGELREAAPLTLRLAAIAELEDAEGQPTAAADPRLTPQLEGVTDADSIGDWDVPFELVETIRREDEDYWDERTTTPKAFVSFALARRLWATRWGDVSLMRIVTNKPTGVIEAGLLERLDPAGLGFVPIAVKRDGLAAASGSTPFDVLFLLFSMFLIAAATMLIMLLVRLAIDARAREIGLEGAIGWDRRTVRRQLLRELLGIVAIGVLLGVLTGVAYAAGLLWALRTVWIDAIVTPFLRLHVSPLTLAGGGLGGLVVAWLTSRWAVRGATRTPARQLLAGATVESASAGPVGGWTRGVAAGLATVAGIVLMVGGTLRGEAAAGAFFGSGGLLLAAALVATRGLLGGRGGDGGRLSLGRLALRHVSRSPGRSLLTVGLIAAASFLILATSAFRLPPTEEGTGGFTLVAQTDQPIHFDLNSEEGRFELGLGKRDEELLAGAKVYGLRVEPGEDASCRNLYQASQPRVLGVTDPFVQRGGFAWAESADGFADNPWRALQAEAGADGPIPVVIDFNTAVYALKLYGGVGSRFTIRDEADRQVELEVVGLLKNSLLQGDLLVSEENLLRVFPSAAGYGFFLIETGSDAPALAARLEDRLGDYGFDAEPASARLAGFLAVQNTYLSTFQALGGLGLLLGAVGLAIAQFRNLSERRGELALLRAGGFARPRLRRMVLLENLLLLGGGLASGAVAAAATLLPLAAAADARPPWLAAGTLIAATVVVGLAAGRIAAGRALAAELTPALRGD